jgi:DNA uptake protein ComE-like DNA-binding protein
MAIVLGVAFALIPWATLGLATPVAFAFATAVLRSRLVAAATVVYTLAVVGMFNTDYPEDRLYGWYITTAFLVGGVHAAIISPHVIRRLSHVRRRAPDEGLIVEIAEKERAALASDPALRAAVRRRERRRHAREIVASDPALATELRIGRPDLTPDYDDGGLVDVNHVPAAILATLPGFDEAMAHRVVLARERFDGLSSAADLIVHANVPNEVAEGLAERLLFRPVSTLPS